MKVNRNISLCREMISLELTSFDNSINLFSVHLREIYYLPFTVLSIGNIAVKKIIQFLTLTESTF